MKPKQKTGRQPARSQPKTDNPETATFDSWLENKLRNAYSSVLDEPLPEDLIRLLSDKLKD